MKNDWLKHKISSLSAEEFGEVVELVSDKMADIPDKPKDELVHITEMGEEIEAEYKNWGKVNGLKTGFVLLDGMIGGLGKGQVILIGGETGNGKSALAANIAVNVSKDHGVLFITLEMLQRELGARLMHINGGSIDDLNIMFQSEFKINYQDVEGLFKKAKEKGKVELVVLDYMQYLGRGMRLEEVAKMSKEMKSLALRYEVPFLVIVSLRKSEGGKNKRKWSDIEIEDLMGTGSIGYDCDVAMIASRKSMEDEFIKDRFYVKVLKTRTHDLDYNNRFITFNWNKTKISNNYEGTAGFIPVK